MDISRTPEGMRDRLFAECRARRAVQRSLCALFEAKGFCEITTPEAEFYDLFVRSGSPIPQTRMIKTTDRSGRIMVLRPDSTTPIARVAATMLSGREEATRLYYNQPVFRSDDAHRGISGEIAQCGVEVIGAPDADFEVVALAVESLRACGLSHFTVELGHVGLRAALMQAEDGRVSARLDALFGGREVLDRAAELPGAREAAVHLRRLYDALHAAGYGAHIRFDLGLAQELDYYTGVVFRGYAEGAGTAILSGGRYDNLVGMFGAPAPAIGFAVDVDAVCALDARRPAERRLRIALTKGRLLQQTIALFEQVGLDCAPLKNPGRRLIHTIPNYPLDVVLAKGPDVITYVEHGVCDLGIAGADSILEQAGAYREVLDLGLGKCRFVLAAPAGSDLLTAATTPRIATKYPNVARRYFEGLGLNVSIIKIEGSVELAPLLSLADGIVDIVETGATLLENGLEPIADVAPVSARLIVNTASMKLHKAEMLDLIRKCETGEGTP